MPERGNADENDGLFGECFVSRYRRLNGRIYLRDVALNLAQAQGGLFLEQRMCCGIQPRPCGRPILDPLPGSACLHA